MDPRLIDRGSRSAINPLGSLRRLFGAQAREAALGRRIAATTAQEALPHLLPNLEVTQPMILLVRKHAAAQP
jgi:hypothetical protein